MEQAPRATIVRLPYFSEQELKITQFIRDRVLVKNINSDTIFAASLHCLLRSTKKRGDGYIYNKLIADGLIEAAHIENYRGVLDGTVEGIKGDIREPRFLSEFINWWKKKNIASEILNDIRMGRKKEFELRENLAKNASGMSYITASMFLIRLGYENVVPVDNVECEFLSSIGHIKIDDYKPTNYIRAKKYFIAEKKIIEFAMEQGLKPAFFHFGLLARKSEQEKKNIGRTLRTLPT